MSSRVYWIHHPRLGERDGDGMALAARMSCLERFIDSAHEEGAVVVLAGRLSARDRDARLALAILARLRDFHERNLPVYCQPGEGQASLAGLIEVTGIARPLPGAMTPPADPGGCAFVADSEGAALRVTVVDGDEKPALEHWPIDLETAAEAGLVAVLSDTTPRGQGDSPFAEALDQALRAQGTSAGIAEARAALDEAVTRQPEPEVVARQMERLIEALEDEGVSPGQAPA